MPLARQPVAHAGLLPALAMLLFMYFLSLVTTAHPPRPPAAAPLWGHGVLRLRGGDTLVNPLHARRLEAEGAARWRKNKGRELTDEERKRESQHPERTLMVRNLCETVDEVHLLNVFSLAGGVVKVTMPRDEETKKHYGYAYLEFRQPFDAVCALCQFNFVKLRGVPMKIMHLIKGKEAEEFYHPGAKLFVSRLAPEVSEWDIWWVFQAFGVVLECHIPANKHTGESRGIAFIRFADFEVLVGLICFCFRSLSFSTKSLLTLARKPPACEKALNLRQ